MIFMIVYYNTNPQCTNQMVAMGRAAQSCGVVDESALGLNSVFLWLVIKYKERHDRHPSAQEWWETQHVPLELIDPIRLGVGAHSAECFNANFFSNFYGMIYGFSKYFGTTCGIMRLVEAEKVSAVLRGNKSFGSDFLVGYFHSFLQHLTLQCGDAKERSYALTTTAYEVQLG